MAVFLFEKKHILIIEDLPAVDYSILLKNITCIINENRKKSIGTEELDNAVQWIPKTCVYQQINGPCKKYICGDAVLSMCQVWSNLFSVYTELKSFIDQLNILWYEINQFKLKYLKFPSMKSWHQKVQMRYHLFSQTIPNTIMKYRGIYDGSK